MPSRLGRHRRPSLHVCLAGAAVVLIVEHCVIVELKSIEAVARVHKKVLLTYLRVADKRLGLLINFGDEMIKDGISRVVNHLEE